MGEGYDVQYFTKNELISDVLKHYERFLKLFPKNGMRCLSAAMPTRIKNKNRAVVLI
jgi:hypothetical protein